MRILLAASAVMLGLFSVPAWALDDTPTQTPYLGNKIDDNRAAVATQRLPAAPAAATRRTTVAQPAITAVPGAAPAVAVAAAPAPLTAALPVAGRAPGLADRAIGWR